MEDHDHEVMALLEKLVKEMVRIDEERGDEYANEVMRSLIIQLLINHVVRTANGDRLTGAATIAAIAQTAMHGCTAGNKHVSFVRYDEKIEGFVPYENK